MTEPLWKQLELLVAEIQRELAPDAEVTHNVRIKGRDSEQMRQVDALVRKQVGQYEIVIAIDCKDYADPVDVKGVEEFQGLLIDIGAHKGAMVCPKGFTPAAKKVATRNQVYDKDGNPLGIPYQVALTRWNNGEYPHETGDHENVPMYPVTPTLVDNGYGTRVAVTLYLSLKVTQRLFFGYLPIVKIRGLRNEHTGAVVTNAFTTGVLDAEEVENSWQRIESEKDAPVRPVMVLAGLDCYKITA